MFNPQQILQNRYQLQQKLGNTAAGRETWLALDLESQQKVIIKLLAFSPQMQWEELKLFEREAQVLKNINHPRIPRYRDYFNLEEQVDIELPWFGLVQDYIPGDSLKELLESGKKFKAAQVHSIATQVLKNLIELHELSPPVLHRDIKPSNLILSENHQVYLVDFGAVQDRAKAEGVTFTVVGTSGYAPPEQLWGKAVASSDLYALGATLIHLLTGISPAELPQQRMQLQFRHLIQIDGDFANWLEQLIQPASEKRFSTARQALSALPSTDSLPATGKKKFPFVSSLAKYGIYSLVILTGLGIPILIVAPSFIHQGDKAKQSEGRQYVGAMNRAQQAYFIENNDFTSNIVDLGLGIKTETTNYSYSIRTTSFATFHYAIPRQKLKGYVGAVFPGTTNNNEITSVAIICEGESPSTKRLPEPILQNGIIKCAPGTKILSNIDSYTITVSPDENLAKTAINYANTGNLEQAIAVIKTIKHDFYKGRGLAAITPKLTTDSQYNQAIEIAKTIKNPHAKGTALDGIIRQLVAKGEYNRGVEIAKTIQSYYGSKEKMEAAIASYQKLQ